MRHAALRTDPIESIWAVAGQITFVPNQKKAPSFEGAAEMNGLRIGVGVGLVVVASGDVVVVAGGDVEVVSV